MTNLNIITILKKDHKEVSALLASAMGEGKDVAERAELIGKITEALNAHMAFEEEFIYPVLQVKKKTQDEALEAYEEHGQVKFMLKEINRTAVTDERWKAKVSVLTEDIKHHVKEEEGSDGILEELKKALAEGELVELGERYLASKEAYAT